MLQNTGNSIIEYSRVGYWLLGHGEWDGCIELWINDALVWKGGNTPPTKFADKYAGLTQLAGIDNPAAGFVFNFHSGCDAPLGAAVSPSSVGPDQGMDKMWPLFPPAIQQLCWSRIAYYGILRKQPIQNQVSDNGSDPNNWTDIAPIGLWRGIKCRIFDDQGNQQGYAFTTNPIWQFVDLMLRRKVMPDYALSATTGPDALTAAAANRFDWGKLFTAAQYCNEFLPNGRRRFENSSSFTSQTSLQACAEKLLQSCRGYATEYAGKIGVSIDMPRSSVFTFSRSHILPGSWNASDQALTKSGNRYIAKFRNLLVPQCSLIASITCGFGQNPVVTTQQPHPFIAGDYIVIGGTGTSYDCEWLVKSVPAVVNPGTITEVDPTQLTLVSQGSNFPASVGAVGGIGLVYSRFKNCTPEFWHKNNMLARGAAGLGIPRQREKVKQDLELDTMTWDQASRIACYERDRALGVDQSPYITPPAVKLRTSMFARDVAGNLAAAIECGDCVTIDDTASFTYTGEYEVLDKTVYVPTVHASGSGGEVALRPDENSGEIELFLGPYNEAVMYDSSDPTEAGWPDVPGSDPGNSTNFTAIPLASGSFSFFTGTAPSGTPFQLPSTGFPVANTLSWAGPAGYGQGAWSGHMATIELCTVGSAFLLSLLYEDNDGSTWQGAVNYACATWLSSDAPTSSGGLSWIELTLAGGEKILFGQGVLADGATIALPTGYVTTQMFAVAFPHDGEPTGGHNAHWCGAYVDSSQTVHLNYKDGDGNVWHGNAAVLVFAWKNNMGTWTTQTLYTTSNGLDIPDPDADKVNWAECPLTGGLTFGVGCALNVPNTYWIGLPASAGDGSTIEVMAGPSFEDLLTDETPTGSGNEAHGIYSCSLSNFAAYGVDDVQLAQMSMEFGDGSGNIWGGTADLFMLYCTPTSSGAAAVNVTPQSASVTTGGTAQFSAAVLNNANQSVTWSVDGIAGGNVTVGTIDATGFYTAPNAAGSHTVTAMSVAVPTASDSAAVAVWAADGSGGWTINGS
jgi:hypothetical protein